MAKFKTHIKVILGDAIGARLDALVTSNGASSPDTAYLKLVDVPNEDDASLPPSKKWMLVADSVVALRGTALLKALRDGMMFDDLEADEKELPGIKPEPEPMPEPGPVERDE